MGQRTDIEFAHPVALDGPAAGGKEMAHGDNRDPSPVCLAGFLGSPADRLIVVPDTGQQFAFLLRYALTGLYGRGYHGRADRARRRR